MYSTYNGGEVWKKKREDGWGDMEAQLRNWNAHLWLSGDSIVEQAVHCIDMMQWAMEDQPPLHAEGSGGRQVYDDPDKYGNIYDHFACVFEWENGAIIFLASKMVLSAVMKLNYLAPKELARRRIGTRLLPVIIHGDIAVKTTTCTRRNTMYCLHQSVQVSSLMMEKKRP